MNISYNQTKYWTCCNLIILTSVTSCPICKRYIANLDDLYENNFENTIKKISEIFFSTEE